MGIEDIVCDIQPNTNTGNHVVPPNCTIHYKIVDIEGKTETRREVLYNVANLTISKDTPYSSTLSYDADTDNYEIFYDFEDRTINCQIEVDGPDPEEEVSVMYHEPEKSYTTVECEK